MLHDAPHLAVLALGEADREPGVAALLPLHDRVDRAIRYAGDADAALERRERGRVGHAVDAHLVAPDPAARRQLERAREPAVIGEEQQPLRIEVEPPDRDDARQLRRQMREDRVATALVAVRRDESGRLVIAPQPRPLALGQRLAVDPDVVARRRPRWRGWSAPCRRA